MAGPRTAIAPQPPSTSGRSVVLPALIAGAWSLVLLAQATGGAAALHHHALIEDGPLIWAAFGLLAFLGDVGLHRLVDATPWLAARPWLIEGAILAIAGAYQFLPLKRRSVAACRHPGDPRSAVSRTASVARFGLHHGLACLGSSWALMLLMFAEGFASLWWMVILTTVMAYETNGRHGHRAIAGAGVFLVLAALIVLSGRPAPTL